jgi:hypothetical protein
VRVTSHIAVEAGTKRKAAGLYPALTTLDTVTPLETVSRNHSDRSAYVVVDKAWATHLGITRKTGGLYQISKLELVRRLAERETRTVSVPDKIVVQIPTRTVGTLRFNFQPAYDGELQPRLTG